MRALDDQVRAGKVLYAGASNWSAWEIAQANTLADLRGWTAFAGLQSQYNLVERTAERELIPMTREFGMALTCWSPLAGGLLTGKYLPDTGDGAGGRLAGRASERIDAARERIIRVVVTIAGELGVPPSQVALAWLLHQPGMVIPMVGASQEAQARENLAAVDVSLDGDQLDRLDIASRVELGYPHDFLQRHDVRQLVYGDRHEQMDDRLAEVGRSVPGA